MYENEQILWNSGIAYFGTITNKIPLPSHNWKDWNMYNLSIKDKDFSITDDAIYHIIQHYTREAGVRELNRYIGALIRKAIKKILLENVDSVHVDENNLFEGDFAITGQNQKWAGDITYIPT